MRKYTPCDHKTVDKTGLGQESGGKNEGREVRTAAASNFTSL